MENFPNNPENQNNLEGQNGAEQASVEGGEHVPEAAPQAEEYKSFEEHMAEDFGEGNAEVLENNSEKNTEPTLDRLKEIFESANKIALEIKNEYSEKAIDIYRDEDGEIVESRITGPYYGDKVREIKEEGKRKVHKLRDGMFRGLNRAYPGCLDSRKFGAFLSKNYYKITGSREKTEFYNYFSKSGQVGLREHFRFRDYFELLDTFDMRYDKQCRLEGDIESELSDDEYSKLGLDKESRWLTTGSMTMFYDKQGNEVDMNTSEDPEEKWKKVKYRVEGFWVGIEEHFEESDPDWGDYRYNRVDSVGVFVPLNNFDGAIITGSRDDKNYDGPKKALLAAVKKLPYKSMEEFFGFRPESGGYEATREEKGLKDYHSSDLAIARAIDEYN